MGKGGFDLVHQIGLHLARYQLDYAKLLSRRLYQDPDPLI